MRVAKHLLLPCGMAVACGVVASSALAQLTAHQIPYQGHLDLQGEPVGGSFNFWFELYPTPEGGSCLTTPPPSFDCLWSDEFLNVNVVGGEFSIVLGSAANPLGDDIWQKPEVYLGIRVAGPGDLDYTQLGGRQRILALPMAARADTAKDYHVTGALLVGAGATVTGGATINGRTNIVGETVVSGNVGINVDPPLAPMHVAGDIRLSGALSYGALKDWRLVFRDDFTGSDTLGWTGAATSECNDEQILGGYNVIANGLVHKVYDLTAIPHTQVKVTLNYYALDSWDGEWAWVRFDGVMPYLWTRQIWVAEPGRYHVCGSTSLDGSYYATLSGTHRADALVLAAGAVLNEGATNESFGIDNVEVWVR